MGVPKPPAFSAWDRTRTGHRLLQVVPTLSVVKKTELFGLGEEASGRLGMEHRTFTMLPFKLDRGRFGLRLWQAATILMLLPQTVRYGSGVLAWVLRVLLLS